MIDAALPRENVQYFTCPAEQLPFQAESFQLITVCGALNWINRSQFFPAAKRVLAPTGWIIIYDNLFHGIMREHPPSPIGILTNFSCAIRSHPAMNAL